MYKKTYLSFRFITSRPLCQVKQADQTVSFDNFVNFLQIFNSPMIVSQCLYNHITVKLIMINVLTRVC